MTSVTFHQSPAWHNWQAIPKVTPVEAVDAPVFIPVAPGNYWLLAGFERFRWLPRSLRRKHKNGYHAWHSIDMKTWTHYGPVTTRVNRWVTSAEHMDGRFYIYFDKPNDEDPHLIIDDNIRDGKQGKEIGMVLKDPSHGSDMAILRDTDGIFHLIYEDWSPVNPRTHSWDSPLAGHADSPDGITGFEPHEFPPPIDKRTSPTARVAEYQPNENQLLDGKDLGPYTYEIHEGPQDAFGDYTLIKVGKQYYLFCDYDPADHNKSMRIGRWRTDDIRKPFLWDGEIGENIHPDPTIGFAEGKFYLIIQAGKGRTDFISDGPWVDGVQARAGVDSDDDGKIDQWTDFTEVKETYRQKEGFARIVESAPAVLDTTGLADGYAFQIEFQTQVSHGVQPVIDLMVANFN